MYGYVSSTLSVSYGFVCEGESVLKKLQPTYIYWSYDMYVN